MGWLRLLADGKRRAEARRGIVELEIMCAVAASLGKGSGPAQGLFRRLKEQAEQ